MSRILIVQHIACETAGLIETVLTEAEFEYEYVRPFAGDRVPREVAGELGLVVMGGPMGVYETAAHTHLDDELVLIRDACRRALPVLGICLGSQLLAAALGAKVEPGERKEIGWFDVTLRPAAAADALFSHASPSFKALHWHGDVFDLPPGAVPLASSRQTMHQAFRWGETAYGVLFHLESTPRLLDGMIATFTDEFRQEKISADLLRQASIEHFPPAQAIGRVVFSQWARLVRRHAQR